MEDKRVGVLTWHYYENVGSNLQAYALQEKIKELGYYPTFINYRQKKYDDGLLKKIIKCFLIKLDTIFNFGHFNKWAFRTLQFKQKYFKQTKVYFDNDELKELNSKFDIFVCGSDQIWAPSVFDKAYFLEFVNSKYKFSYAASLGLNMIPNELKKEYHDLLLDFDSVSVREKKGQDLLKELGVNSTVVLDPTFLLNKNRWLELVEKRIIKEDYVFCYFLGNQDKFRKVAVEYARNQHKKLIIYSSNFNDKNYCDKYINKMSPEEFLTMIYYASEILTDSFHGITMSLIFNKQFASFLRFDDKNMNENNQNSRIYNILNLLDLNNTLIVNDNQSFSQIDYSRVNIILEKEIEKSVDFLKENLLHSINK